MQIRPYPVIDPFATGNNIRRLRMERGMSVRELQAYFGFEQPQAIYKWQQGTSLPSVDNLYALGALLEVPMDEILVSTQANITKLGQQEKSCCPQHISVQFYSGCPGRGRRWEPLQPFCPGCAQQRFRKEYAPRRLGSLCIPCCSRTAGLCRNGDVLTFLRLANGGFCMKRLCDGRWGIAGRGTYSMYPSLQKASINISLCSVTVHLHLNRYPCFPCPAAAGTAARITQRLFPDRSRMHPQSWR